MAKVSSEHKEHRKGGETAGEVEVAVRGGSLQQALLELVSQCTLSLTLSSTFCGKWAEIDKVRDKVDDKVWKRRRLPTHFLRHPPDSFGPRARRGRIQKAPRSLMKPTRQY